MIRFFIIVFLFLVSCQKAPDTNPNEIVVGIEKYPEQADPRLASDSISQKINRLLYSSLMQNGSDMKMECDLCESYQRVSPTHYRFTLKRGVVFHNGKKLTSKDIKATIESITKGNLASAYKSDLRRIDVIETPNDYQIDFKLHKPYSSFLTLMALGILPESVVAKDHVIKPEEFIGSGPFKANRSSWTETRLALDRNENYFGTKPKIQKLIFRVVQDSTLRALELIKGRLDIIQNGIPYVLAGHLRKEKNLKYQSAGGVNFSYIAFNFKNTHLAHKKVREAIDLAINREELILYKLSGLGQLATSILNPKHWMFNANLPLPSYNPQKAKELLDEAGYPDPDGEGPKTRFNLVYKTSTDKERVAIVQLIAEDLEKIGIGITVVTNEFGTFYRDIRQGNFDLFSLTWVGVSDPAIYDIVAHTNKVSPQGANRGFYSNTTLDRLLDEATQTLDEEKQRQLYLKIQKIFFEDKVYAPLWYERNFVFSKKNIQDFIIYPNASYWGLTTAFKMPQASQNTPESH